MHQKTHKLMKRLDVLLLFVFASLCISTMSAQEVSVDVAKGRALDFLSSQSVGPKYAKGTASSSDLKLAYTSKSEGKTCFYVFNVGDGDGFVIAGGDESARQILGYSTCGTFDYDQAPDNFRWWLSQYTEQIAHAEAPSQEALAAAAAYRAKAAQTREDVAPLMETSWNQTYPYNTEIPVYESNGSPYLTGCVATAMAQVMKRWNYPEHGTGSFSYTDDGHTFSADFGNTTYDWDNMLTSYKGRPITDDNIKAVGTLMYHAGVALEMNYGVGESGASDSRVGPALVKYFGYDKSVRHESRNYFTDEGWEELIYNELSAGRPVPYSGFKSDGYSGHEFVCDGYQASTNMFHMNWGWGGVDNNYFTLRGDNALVPSGFGTGGYNQSQEVTVNIKPDEGGEPTPHIVLELGNYAMYMEVNREKYYDNYTYDKGMGNKKLEYNIEVTNRSCVFNNAVYFPEDANVNIQLGVKAVDRESSTVQYFNFGNSYLLKNEIINFIYGYSTNINLSDFEYNGIYELHPVFRIEGTEEWKDIQVPASKTIPTITILGAINRTPTNVHFFISGSEMVEEETVQITHDSNYQGAVTYSSSNPAVATVDAQGVVTGVSAGTAVITARGEADPERLYLATETTFEVRVNHIEKSDPNFTIAKTDIVVGDVIRIKWANDYDGELTFTSSNPSIAKVDAQGKVTGRAEGTAVITAVATETPHFSGSQATFTVTVYPLKITFIEEPYFNNDNNAYRNDIVMYYTVRNDCGVTHDIKISTTLYLTDALIASPGNTHRSVPDGGVVEGSIDFGPFLDIMESNGKLPDANTHYTVYLGSRSVNFIYRNTLTVDYAVGTVGFGTLILPFNAELPSGMKVYSCSEVDANGVLNLTEESSIRRNIPYIVNATPGEYSFVGPEAIDAGKSSFQEGILVGAVANDVSLNKGTDYILQEQNGKVAFYQYTGTKSDNPSENDADGNRLAKPFRAFIRLEGSGHAPKINLPGDEETGIKEITTPSLPSDATNGSNPSKPSNLSNFSNPLIYSLDGHRHSSLQKGLNILILDDGTVQKVFVK